MPNTRESAALSNRRTRSFAFVAAMCLGALGLCAPAAHAATGNLPGGTPISVTINTPANNTVVNSPPGEVTVAGTASVGTGVARADTSLIYVIDVSGSTTDFPGAGCGGDQNNDTRVSTILDCEIAAARALNQKAIAAGTVDEVSVVFFSGTAVIQDVNPVVAGVQTTTTPGADLNTNGIPDVEEAMTKATTSEFTNFEAAVQRACQVAQTSTNPNTIGYLFRRPLSGAAIEQLVYGERPFASLLAPRPAWLDLPLDGDAPTVEIGAPAVP